MAGVAAHAEVRGKSDSGDMDCEKLEGLPQVFLLSSPRCFIVHGGESAGYSLKFFVGELEPSFHCDGGWIEPESKPREIRFVASRRKNALGEPTHSFRPEAFSWVGP